MQTTSALYKQILADPQHVKEWRAQIGDLTFDKTNTVSIRRSSALYGKQLIGGACSGSLELVLWDVALYDYCWNRYVNIVTHHWKKYSVDVTHTDTNLGTTGTKNYSHVGTPETMVINAVPPIVVIDGQPKYDFSGGRQTVVQTDYTPVGSYCAANADSIKTATGGVANYQSLYAKVLSIKDNSLFGWISSSDANAEIHGIQTARNRGAYIEDVSSANQGSYPQDGEQDGFWYVYDGYTQERGTLIDSVYSKNQSAYPQDGIQDGYWYVFTGREATDVPEMARIELSVRLVSDLGTSEWLPMGTYWIDRRSYDEETGELTLQCVDGMMYGEQDFYPAGSEITGWTNKTMREVAQICATKMGIALEDETQFQNAAPYVLTAPPIGYTVRQVLQGIAAAHGGNIIVTADNKMRLVPFVPTNSGADLGQHAASLEAGRRYEAFGNVIFNFESIDGGEQIVRYPATEASGATMEAPLLTVTDSGYARTIAQNVLTALGSYRYAPYRAADALLDPAMDLGDGLTVGGLYSVIAEADEICDELYSASIGAESFQEVKNEFVFQPSLEKTVARKIAQSSASLKIDIDSIKAQVTDGQGNYTALTLRSDGLHVGNAQGTVTIGSGSIHIPNGEISFGDGTLNGALQAAYNNSGDDNPSYIHSTYISQTKVISPHIYGGDLYATGQGNTSGTNPAFYMSDGVTGTGGNTTPNAPRGWLCYDKNGAGTTQEAQNRVFLHSVDGVAMKLEAGGNMSLEANDSIYLRSYLKLRNGINYGTAAQRDAITPENGQIFWVVS